MNHLLTVLVALVTLLCASNPSYADLDVTFGTGGRVTTDVGGANALGDLVIQADGKIVAAGSDAAGSESARDFALARYNTDGSLDAAFGTGGLVTTDFGGSDHADALALQSDGKLVAVGHAGFSTGNDFALARYNTDGSLDSTFGSGGLVTLDINFHDSATALVIQSDGKIIAAGLTDSSATDFALARFNPDGSVDTTFGTGGVVVTDFGGFDRAWALVLQADGKLIAGGNTAGSGAGFLLARYNGDGSLDTSFGTGGLVTTDIAGGGENLFGLVLQSDGAIVGAGNTDAGGTVDFALARYNTDGSLDGSFGTAGIVITDFSGGFDGAEPVVIEADGHIVAAGGTTVGGNTDFALARYDSAGTLVATKTTDFSSASDSASQLLLQADGKLVAGGVTGTHPATDFALARYVTLPFCDETPATGCRLGLPLKSSLQLKDNLLDDTKDSLKWKWNKGAPSGVDDFADPVGGSASYRICLYDGSSQPQPLREAAVLPGGMCDAKPCWKLIGTVTSPKGYKYKNKAATPDGVTSTKLQAGIADKAKVQVAGKGALLALPALGLTSPVTVQLVIDDNWLTRECWQSTFTLFRTNTTENFKAKGP